MRLLHQLTDRTFSYGNFVLTRVVILPDLRIIHAISVISPSTVSYPFSTAICTGVMPALLA